MISVEVSSEYDVEFLSIGMKIFFSQTLKQEWGEGVNPSREPHHYGSHYSNSGTVLHFLLRLPPYTKMFLQYQGSLLTQQRIFPLSSRIQLLIDSFDCFFSDDKFDLADRTFHSLQTTWRLTSADSTTDVKELIPEFFFLPEFLVNSEGNFRRP